MRPPQLGFQPCEVVPVPGLMLLFRSRLINRFQPGRHIPQGLKPASFRVLNGTAEAVPYPKPLMCQFYTSALHAKKGPMASTSILVR
jgi:hypothetical protein